MDIKLLWNLYHWIEKKLNRKYILGMTSGLLAISILFAIMFIGMYQKQLTSERANTSLHLNKLLQTSLENSMLKRDLNGLRDILTDFGQQDEIQRVMIFNPQGIQTKLRVNLFEKSWERYGFPDMMNARKILELGTSFGTTTLSVVRHNPETVVHTIEGSPDIFRYASEMFQRKDCKSTKKELKLKRVVSHPL